MLNPDIILLFFLTTFPLVIVPFYIALKRDKNLGVCMLGFLFSLHVVFPFGYAFFPLDLEKIFVIVLFLSFSSGISISFLRNYPRVVFFAILANIAYGLYGFFFPINIIVGFMFALIGFIFMIASAFSIPKEEELPYFIYGD